MSDHAYHCGYHIFAICCMERNRELFEEAVQKIDKMPELSKIHKEAAWKLLQGCDPKNVKPGIAIAFRYINFVTSEDYGKTEGRVNRPSPQYAKSA